MKLTLVPVTKSITRTSFDCGYQDLNQYLRHYALKNDQLSISKTFIAITETEHVAGYMTISTAQIAAESLPEELRVKLPRYPVPAFRIGKLAVDLQFQGSGIGSWLLTEACKKAVEVSQSVGLFAVLVDAIDEKAKSFYEKYGFVPFSGHPLTLFLPLATLKAAIH